MKRIASFEVDHTTLTPGLYLSRTDGDVTTYDLRFIRPNTPPYLPCAVMHTIEHLFAAYVRNSALADGVVYFGPMGCRTGFYFLTRGISHRQGIALTREALRFIAGFEGDIPGATAAECGNFREHDLQGARRYAAAMAERLENWREEDLSYSPKI